MRNNRSLRENTKTLALLATEYQQNFTCTWRRSRAELNCNNRTLAALEEVAVHLAPVKVARCTGRARYMFADNNLHCLCGGRFVSPHWGLEGLDLAT